jgi:hypothetical protein
LAIGFSTRYAYQEYTEPYPFTRIFLYFFDSFNGWRYPLVGGTR